MPPPPYPPQRADPAGDAVATEWLMKGLMKTGWRGPHMWSSIMMGWGEHAAQLKDHLPLKMAPWNYAYLCAASRMWHGEKTNYCYSHFWKVKQRWHLPPDRQTRRGPGLIFTFPPPICNDHNKEICNIIIIWGNSRRISIIPRSFLHRLLWCLHQLRRSTYADSVELKVIHSIVMFRRPACARNK